MYIYIYIYIYAPPVTISAALRRFSFAISSCKAAFSSTKRSHSARVFRSASIRIYIYTYLYEYICIHSYVSTCQSTRE